MSPKANPALIGSFVLGALLLLVAGLLLLGGGRLFEDTYECVLYFDESISGLDIGAPVDFQGIRIGSVTDIRLVFDDSATGQIYRPVRIRLEDGRINYTDDLGKGRKTTATLESLVVRKGLRARLATQSLLTGKLMVELGLFPDKPIRRVRRDTGIWEMPTIPSPLQEVSEEMEDLPLAAIVHETHRAIQHIADMLSPEKGGQTLQHLNDTLASLDSVLNQIQQNITPLAEQGSGFLRTAQTSLEDFQSTLRGIDQRLAPLLEHITGIAQDIDTVTDPDSLLREELTRLIEEIRATSQSVRYLANTLEENPESLLRGKKNTGELP